MQLDKNTPNVGYVSVRNEIAGSWLGTALGYYLMTCAWEKDLEEILAMVSDKIL